MRISTTMQYTNSLSYIKNSNSKVDEQATKYNSGLKFQCAGEDPSGMASKVKYEGAIAAYKQYIEAGGIANNSLSEEETALSSMWDTLSSVHTRLQQCVNGSNDSSSLKALSAEIAQLRDHLFDLMNTQNTEGEYIFTGAQSDIETYTLTSTGKYICQADGSTRGVVVAPSVNVQVSDSGLDIFENCKTAYEINVNTNPNPTYPPITGYERCEIKSYGTFNKVFEDNYDPAGNNATGNMLRIYLDGTGNFTLYGTDGGVIDTGVVDTSTSINKISVRGMEFTIANANENGYINIELEKPKNENMLNILTDIVSTINDDSVSNVDKIAAITKCQVDVELALSHYDSYRGQIGARQNAIENVLNANESLSAIKVESKANVSEVDAFDAASELIRAQNQLTVSRQIYSMLNKQSLFDFI
ncbi:flagellar hook-associated protein 3 FlgL [Succinivibrio dextrinosolvens]|uniref:flagellar hook-associated protein FlgL n=1 Tax=Succinivibrio dextrinosolvens TaxID=83771 RepID=UPI0008F1CD67|nr:flagellar hook-associated protein FlgL [Succinivibrio dextrinosolvens]SFS46855.1 flagellar hook-associated protein 3 FlgL [Succinivibrio dextrinosolvens]